MDEYLSPSARRAVQTATEWAGRLGASQVEPPHLLLAIAAEEESHGAAMLTRHGLQLASLRATVGVAELMPDAESDARRLPPASEPVGKVLGRVRGRSIERGPDNPAGTEHMLLELLAAAPELNSVLSSLGVNVANLLSELEHQASAEHTPLAAEFVRLELTQTPRPSVTRSPAPHREPDETAFDEGFDWSEVHHILDAAAGHARQGIRLLEEFARHAQDRAVPPPDERVRLDGVVLYVLVTSEHCPRGLEWTVREALAGGAQVIQLREKRLADRELVALSRRVRDWTREAGALFIMNDRPDIARLTDADGVHVGQEELSVEDARLILGPRPVVGVSTHSIGQARQAVLDGADYLGVGPTFPSQTKGFTEFPGVGLVRQVHAEIRLPTFVIGGVDLDHLDEVLAAGAHRVAVSSAICGCDDPRAVAAQFRQRLGERQEKQAR